MLNGRMAREERTDQLSIRSCHRLLLIRKLSIQSHEEHKYLGIWGGKQNVN